MAIVKEPRLSVERVRESDGQWWLTVSYTIEFSRWEQHAWFTEVVEILGGSPRGGGEILLATMRSSPFQLEVPSGTATSDGAHFQLHRSTPRVQLRSDQLDVNPDLAILGETSAVVWARAEGIRARIALSPIRPSGATVESNVVVGQFGQ